MKKAIEILESKGWSMRAQDGSGWIGIDIDEPENPKDVWEIYCDIVRDLEEVGVEVKESQLEHDYIGIKVSVVEADNA